MAIKNARYYNADTYMWEQVNNLDIGIRKDSIILRNGELIKPSQLEKGQKISRITSYNVCYTKLLRHAILKESILLQAKRWL